MKKIFILLAIVSIASCMNLEELNPDYYTNFSPPGSIHNHPRANELQDFVDAKVREGLPGLNVMVRTKDGQAWAGAAGSH